MTAHRIFREAALRRHRERPTEVHFPKLAEPRMSALAWAALFVLLAGVAAGASIPVPELAAAEVFALEEDGRTVWIAAVPPGTRVEPGQRVVLGDRGARRCSGRVGEARAIAGVARRSWGDSSCDRPEPKLFELTAVSGCAPAAGEEVVPAKIELGRRRLASLIPGLDRRALDGGR